MSSSKQALVGRRERTSLKAPTGEANQRSADRFVFVGDYSVKNKNNNIMCS